MLCNSVVAHAEVLTMAIRVYQPPHSPITFTGSSKFTFVRFRKPSNPRILCNATEGDFVSRVLKQNPSQVEPRFLIRDNVYTFTEKEGLKKKWFDFEALEWLKRLNLKGKEGNNEVFDEENGDRDVYLKDIVREYRGKLYVPEQMFRSNLSEEEGFDREFDALCKINFQDFLKFMRSDKVKLLRIKERRGVISGSDFRDFIVELKETSGFNGLHRTKWAMRLDSDQAHMLLEEYNGPQYEIETPMTTSIGNTIVYPNPVASSISSRISMELAMISILMTTAGAFVTIFLASAAFLIAGFVFIANSYIIWPIVRPFLKVSFGIICGILEGVRHYIYNVFGYGGVFSKLQRFYTFGGVSSSLEMLKPIILVLTIMVLLVRFTLSRKPRDHGKWDIWQALRHSESKPEARVDGSTGVTFGDVAGIEEAVEELQELVNYLKNPDLFDKKGIKPPHGVLLEGPPGCGKTLVAKAIAGEAGVPFYQMAGSEFVEVLVGVGASRIRDLFKRAKVNKPSVIFIDEIDALATRRQDAFTEPTDNTYNAATQERETTLNQLLIELDGFDTGKGVIFLAATNRMDLLDPALLRPGRFDRKIRVQPPNAQGRLDILKVHSRRVKLSTLIDLSTYANDLHGWTGARLAQLLQVAALVAARKGHDEVQHSDIDEAVDRLTIGPKRVGLELGKQGQCRRATTEIGTALTSHLLRRLENAQVECCDRVSINPRSQTLSQVVFHRLHEEAYMFERKPQLLHRLQVLLGGRAAEEVVYGHDSSTASVNYLADATWLARKIVTIWNLENPIVIHGERPPWRKGVNFIGPRLEFEGSLYEDYDLTEPPINFNLDDRVAERTEDLLKEMYQKTVSLLKRHNAALLKTIKVLLNQKEIKGAEIEYILETYPEETKVSFLLEEQNPGSLPFFWDTPESDLEHALAN